MISADDIRTLADLAGPERAFLTVYLDAQDDASVLDARFEELKALLADRPAETEHFEQNLAVARHLLEEHAAPPGGALAVYAGWATDLARAEALPVPVGTRARVGDAPYVRPAAELLDEHETFAVAVVDNTVARIFLVTAEDAEAEARVRGDVKNRVKKGGWSQKRYARRREKQIEGYATEVADALKSLRDERPFERLVLLGTPETVSAVADTLPTALADLLVGTDTVSADASDEDLIGAAEAIAEAGEREEEEALWIQIREQALGSDLAAFGATRVLEALELARVDTVLVDRGLDVAGTRCRDCEHGTPETCQRCGSSDVFRVDLVETMTGMAVRSGASVDFADPFPALTDVGGVAALLRYSLAENDAEQQERERRARAEQEVRERAEREPVEAEAPTLEDQAVAAAVAARIAALVVEPAAEPVAEPAAKPAPSSASPRREARTSRAPDRPTPSAVAETTGAESTRKGIGWVLLALGLILAVLVLLFLL